MNNNIKPVKALIEIPSWLGDFVMSTPSIENIINHYQDIEITIIGSSAPIEAIKNHPKVVRTMVLDKRYKSLYKACNQLGEFDIYFTFRSSFRAKFLKFFIKAKKKYQYNNIYQDCHQVEKYNKFINDSLNANFKAGTLSLPVEIVRKNNKSRTVGINPGASYGNAKRWYPKEFGKVAEELSKTYNIIIFGNSNEVQFALEIEKLLVSKGVENYINLSGKTSISELIKSISKLDLFITGDSGPMHIAACFKIPTVALFGPTNDLETSQWLNKRKIIIKKNLACQPCLKRICPLGHHNCMKLIDAKEVIDAIKKNNFL